jgi:hypothetical protein
MANGAKPGSLGEEDPVKKGPCPDFPTVGDPKKKGREEKEEGEKARQSRQESGGAKPCGERSQERTMGRRSVRFGTSRR